MKRLSIVVPCYNEEEMLVHSAQELAHVMQTLVKEGLVSPESEIYFVDDGSCDKTWTLIERTAAEYPCIRGLKLSGNRGHQNAIMAGMLTVPGDMVLTIDADLQDDVGAIGAMVRHHLQGAEIVYGVRNDRTADTFFKRFTAEFYYTILKRMGVKVVFNHADYRLMGRAALNALADYHEVNLFVRGIIPQLGFTTAYVEYARKERLAGESKYPLRKMLSLAWNGITSFSILPLRLIFYCGLVISLAAFGLGTFALLLTLFTTHTVPGWASTVVPMFFLGGIQLISTGIIGEYIGKIYLETKRRPRFHIEKQV